ncbi:hypothetical protein [Corynebacterium lubricantis]|uniref:hypothetical protein n=1 Tax=Corynebacterium lubricantis TaxID=541095 RepID=UPI000371E111|nr:hypothetical protein [Corynebacterium lubricantis]
MSESSNTLADVGALVRERGDALRDLVHQQLFEALPPARGIFPEDLSGAHMQLPLATAWALEHSLSDESLSEDVSARVRALGAEHRRHGFPSDTYDSFGEILGNSVAQVVGADLAAERVEAARGVITQICQAMKESASEADLAGIAPAHAAEVASIEQTSQSVAVVHLESPTPIDYTPGQFLPVMLPSQRGSWLKFAPAFPSNQFGQLEFHVSLPNDAVSAAQPGEYWTIGEAMNGFAGLRSGNALDSTLDARRDVLMVALGTGLAPIKALIFQLLEADTQPNVSLIISAQHPDDFYDLATFIRLAQTHQWLSVTLHVEQAVSEALDVADENVIPVALPITSLVSGVGMWWGRTVIIGGDKDDVDPVCAALLSAEADPARIFVATPEGPDHWSEQQPIQEPS